jgi:hypothetical protein
LYDIPLRILYMLPRYYKNLWGSILQEFPNLEGVKESEYLKYMDSESESDCEGRFSSCMDGGDDEGSESESE